MSTIHHPDRKMCPGQQHISYTSRRIHSMTTCLVLLTIIFNTPSSQSLIIPRHSFINTRSIKSITHNFKNNRNYIRHDAATIPNNTPPPSSSDSTTPNKSRRHLHRSRLKPSPPPSSTHHITSIPSLHSYFNDTSRLFRTNKISKHTHDDIDYTTLLKSLTVTGDTQLIGSPSHPSLVHPVLRALHDRRLSKSQPGRRTDGLKIALAIEGGGMRGCVTAGMVTAIDELGLTDCFDAVYGSSAGSLIGAYLITRQLPYFGPEIYYDSLTTAGRRFIDTKRLLRAMGVGLLHPLLLKDVVTRKAFGKPVLDLNYLLKETAIDKKPLDWETFEERQGVQPLKVVASGLKSEKAVVFDYERGDFRTVKELTDCMHASCLLPGIAGPLMNVESEEGRERRTLVLGNDLLSSSSSTTSGAAVSVEPLADALIYEPLPYRSALAEGATHVLVLRSRPDGVDVTGKTNPIENLIWKRFFLKKNKLPRVYSRLRRQEHKKLYGEDILYLNERSNDFSDHVEGGGPKVMAIAIPPGSAEVTRLETGRRAIFEGVKRGFARAFDSLVWDASQRGEGVEKATERFPDNIMDYDPDEIAAAASSGSNDDYVGGVTRGGGESAYEMFLRKMHQEETERGNR